MHVNITIFTLFLIILLIIPGVIFKRFYFQGAFSKQFGEGPVGDRFYTSVFWGFVVQCLTYYTFSRATGMDYNTFRVHPQAALSQLNAGELPSLSRELIIYPGYYFLLSLFFAIAVGYFMFHFVRKTKLDVRFSIFRFSNMWNYYFSGEIIRSSEFKSANTPNRKITSTVIDVLVNYGEGANKLFSGTLSHYDLNTSGDLETLYLTETSRYKYMEGKPDSDIKPIPGDCFVIPYKNVLNMNIQYLIDSVSDAGNGLTLKKKWHTSVAFIFSILQIISFLTVLVLPWTSDVGLFWKFLGLFSLFLSWLFAMTIVSEYKKISWEVRVSTWLLFSFFLISSNFILDLKWEQYLIRAFFAFIDLVT